MTTVYTNEFESNGELAAPVTQYLAFGIFLFQISMCGLFTSIIAKNNIAIASLIVVAGEILYMIVYRFFNTIELRETFDEILKENTIDGAWEQGKRLTQSREIQSTLTSAQKEKLKQAYLHPYEKYERTQTALRNANAIKKEY